jgi:hypothetical protein
VTRQPQLKPRHWNKVPQRQFRAGLMLAGLIMNLRIVFFALGILLAAAALLIASGVAEVEVLTDRQCGASGYLCDPPTADADHVPVERVGAR